VRPRTEINVYAFGTTGQCVQDDEGLWLVRYYIRGTDRKSKWAPYAGVGKPPGMSQLPVLVLHRRVSA
jgi:hypothetical protein